MNKYDIRMTWVQIPDEAVYVFLGGNSFGINSRKTLNLNQLGGGGALML